METPSTPPTAWTIDPRSNASIAAVQKLLEQDIPVYRVRSRSVHDDRTLEVGTIIVPAESGNDTALTEIVSATGVDVATLNVTGEIDVWRQTPVRLGVYQPWTECIDEGWARWVLEAYGVPYTTLHMNDVRQGDLRERFDTILIPQMSEEDLRSGRPEKGRYKDPMPPEYVGGLGEVGLEALRRFVDAGGTLIGIDTVTPALIDAFALPMRNPLGRLKDDEFYCPGSLLKAVFDTKDPLAFGMARETPVLFLNSVAFESLGPEARMVAQYPATNPNMSGWILGAEHLERRGLLADVAYGDGRLILFGFRPYFRAQTRVTYKPFFNAIARAGLQAETITL